MRIAYDFDWLHQDAVGENGVSSQELAELEQTHPRPLRELTENPHKWPLGWLDIETRTAEVPSIRRASASVEASEVLITIGMGGSTLGTRALAAAFAQQTSACSFSANGHELILLDNLDEAAIIEIAEYAKGRPVALNPVSKSGNTLETVANFLALSRHPAFEKAAVVVTTGNRKGALAVYAREMGLPILPIPEDVGGRFSVLSPVALFPLSFLGYPIEQLLAGAAEAHSQLTKDDYAANPSLALAARLYLLAETKGIDQLVLWTYSNALREWGRWWVQLVAESLGKQKQVHGEPEAVGLTPVTALGPAGQHSLLQLVLDGPSNKVSGFIQVTQPPAQLAPFSSVPECLERFQYLRDRRIHELVVAELEGTRNSLRRRGRPSYLLRLRDLQPEVVGELLLFFETVVTIMGRFLQINPFNQPAVEESKQLARKLLQDAQQT